MYSKILFNSPAYRENKDAIDKAGLEFLWGCPEDFEIASAACISLSALRKRWPSMTEAFIAENLRHDSRALPIAGLLCEYKDKASYKCKPIFGYFEHLSLPAEHPDYASRFPLSYQCFASSHSIQDFVLPLYKVEEYEKAHPEILRPATRSNEQEQELFENTRLQELIRSLSGLPLEELAHQGNKKYFIAALLHAAKVPAKIVYPLLAGKTDTELGGMQKYVSRNVKKAHDLLENNKK